MANSQEGARSQPVDPLAAVVLHTLVSRGQDGMTMAAVARACERDPENPGDAREMEAALEILVKDGLAERMEGRAPAEPLVRPTRAAVRAEELSF